MTMREPKARSLRVGFGVGALVVFLLVVVPALLLGADPWYAVGVGLFVGVFVGGGLGILLSGRLAAGPD
jgi:hypothetical protein